MLGEGGEVWVGDETTVRELPPLRASWSKVGQQAEVVITGKNPRKVLHGALNVETGEQVFVTRDRGRGEDVIAFVEVLGAIRPLFPKLLIWDNAAPHKPKLVQAALAERNITVVWLPFRSPELNPIEDLWRHLKLVVAANRVFENVTLLSEAAVTWLTTLGPVGRKRAAALLSTKFQWLPT